MTTRAPLLRMPGKSERSKNIPTGNAWRSSLESLTINSSLKTASALAPVHTGFSSGLRYLVRNGKHLKREATLARIRHRIFANPPGVAIPLEGYTVYFNDAANLYILYKDIFIHRIYHFEASRPD